MELTKYQLGDLLINYDYMRKPLSSLVRSEMQGCYPYYGAQGIIDHINKYNIEGKYLLIAEDGENLSSRKEPIAFFADGQYWVNNHAHIVRTNGLADLNYIRYALNSMDISGYVTGAAQPKLSQGKLNKITLMLPNLTEQQKIASILSTYDSQIENNQKRIKVLEQLVENLYKEWFVRFRFPGYERVEFEGGIPRGWNSPASDNKKPKGWKYGELKELGAFVRGKNITSAEMIEGQIPVISAGLEPSGYHNKANVSGPCLTISSSGANAGFLKYNLTDIWAADCSYYNNPNNIWFVYSSLKYLQPVISNLQCGAAQPHVYPKDVNRLCVILPPKPLIEEFNKHCCSIFESIQNLNNQVSILTYQRDLLLPRLMSGKLSI